MEENEIDENPSAFPLFNFAALKQSFTNAPADIASTKHTIQPSNLLFEAKKEPEEKIIKKKQTRAKTQKKKKKNEGEESKMTIKDILEDLQTGIPMEADLKMKEEKLKKMKEGKAKKKQSKTQSKEGEAQKEDEEKSQTIKTGKQESQLLMNLGPEFQDINAIFPSTQIVFKDGKPVLENTDLGQDLASKGSLTLIESTKPAKLTSMSFRKKSHTKQWTEEETRRFYKALELFGSDFSMITNLFPTRDRVQIKNKLHKEERENPTKVEDAFKQHKRSNRKFISHLGDMPRKQIKGEFEPLPQLEKLNNITSDNRNRSFSNYSLDSVDAKIVEDLKDIFTKEIQPKNKELYNLIDEPQKDVSDLESEQDSKDAKVNALDLKLIGDSFKENNNKDNVNHEIHKPKIEEIIKTEPQNVNKNNLLFNLFNK